MSGPYRATGPLSFGRHARIGCDARAAGHNRFAHARAAALAPRRATRITVRLPPTGALRADVAPRSVRVSLPRASSHRTLHMPRAPASPRARPSVLLVPRACAHVRVQFAVGPARNCVLDASRRGAILNAVEAMPWAPRSMRAPRRDRAPRRRARRDSVGAARAPPRRASRVRGRHAPALHRIVTSPFDPPSQTGARPPCPHFAISATPGRPLRAQP
ncbi:hypothetical protein J2785_001536 [Burkholderia ambifaria]|nr:hypothetical protein [Burkholderia ambifaria]